MAFGDDFTGFKALAHEVFLANELGTSDPYAISYAGKGESGFSFGQNQFDLSQSDDAQTTLENVLIAYELDSTTITDIMARMTVGPIDENGTADDGSKPLEETITISWIDEGKPDEQKTIGAIVNEALASPEGQAEVNNGYETYLDNRITFVDNLVSDPSMDTRVSAFFGAADTRADMGKAFLIDYDNQLGIDQPGAMETFLQGGAPSYLGGTVQIVGNKLGFDDLLNAYFATRYSIASASGAPEMDDLARRFTNVADISYQSSSFSPIDEEEAKGLIRIEQQYIDQFRDQVDHPEHFVAFHNAVIDPAEVYLITRDQGVTEAGATITGDVIVGEDFTSIQRNSNIVTADDVRSGTTANDLIYGEEGEDELWGGADSDVIHGGDDDDELYGEGGDDYLRGGAGEDDLAGGAGFDTYVHNSGDGISRITDSDGAGEIVVDGAVVSGGEALSGDASAKGYLDAGNRYYLYDDAVGDVYVVPGSGGGTQQMSTFESTSTTTSTTSTTGAERVEVRGFQAGDLGISFTAAAPVTYDNAIFGDPAASPSDTDTIQGTTANDDIVGYAAQETVYGDAGDDRIAPGGSDDWVDGGTGNDEIHGGDAADNLLGMEGNDTLHGDAGRDLLRGDGSAGPSAGGDRDTIVGGVGSDFLSGSYSDDWLEGGDGVDLMVGGDGVDYLNGGAGDDHLHGDAEIDLVAKGWSITYDPANTRYVNNYTYNDVSGYSENSASDGFDVLHGGFGNDVITGGGGTDYLYGDEDDDWLEGGAGDDRIEGGIGLDTLHGDTPGDQSVSGNDVLRGGDGDDIVVGGLGDDELHGDAGNDELHGDDSDLEAQGLGGADYLAGGAGDDVLSGGVGVDELVGGLGADALWGGVGGDTLAGGVGDDTLRGEEGNDILSGGAGLDQLSGGDGDDQLSGDEDADNVQGGLGNDVLYGGYGDDQVAGQEGADELHGDDGIDTLLGGAGNDSLSGGTGNDTLYGEAGVDTLHGDAGADELQGGIGDDVLHGGSENDRLYGQENNDTLYGGVGDDELQGGTGSDALDGGSGVDTLYGGAGADTLAGGGGDDQLLGEAGNDIYSFALGDGVDVIQEATDTTADVLRFGPGIAPPDISVRKRGADLELVHENGTDQVIVANWYVSPDHVLGSIEFDDGTTWTGAEAGAMGQLHIVGTSGDDLLNGNAEAQLFEAYAGNDTVYGNGGDDTLDGGQGEDQLNGGTGNDTFLHAVGDGNDTVYDSAGNDVLHMGTGVASADVEVERTGHDLLMRHWYVQDAVQTLETVTFQDWYAGTSNQYQVEEVTFADEPGVVLTADELSNAGTFYDHDYTFNVGNGAATIEDWGGVDTLTFDAGIAPADISVERAINDLALTHVNGTDRVTIVDWFNDTQKQIETFTFASDGTQWLADDLTTPLLDPTGTAGDDVLHSGDAYGETLDGGGGIDALYGNGGDDTLIGGTGNDELYGGEGDDLYLFGSGDGQDLLSDGSGIDVLRFEGLSGDDASWTFNVNGDDRLISFSSGESVQVVDWEAGSAPSRVELVVEGTSNDDQITGSNFEGDVSTGDVIYGYGGSDTLNGGEGDDHLYGGDGNDVLQSTSAGAFYGSDRYYGGTGDDRLGAIYAAEDPDRQGEGNSYRGGAGNDLLYGGSHRDLYYFAPGDGEDTIYEQPYLQSGIWYTSFDDKLYLEGAVSPDDVSLDKVGEDLVIDVSATDTITVSDWFYAPRYRVDQVQFDDGTLWYDDDIIRQVFTQHGTAGDDTLTGDDTYGDALYGYEGNDSLIGQGGNDLLDGGSGNDQLSGGSGDDVYVFDRGYGRDTIDDKLAIGVNVVEFGAGVTAADVQYSREVDDLVLTIADTGDQLAVREFLNSQGARDIAFQFTDATSLPPNDTIYTDLLNLDGTESADVLNGSEGADIINAFAGDDTLLGNGGDDMLYGGDGNDTLDGGAGVDSLDGGAGDDTYVYTPDGNIDTITDTAAGANTVDYETTSVDDVLVAVTWEGAGNTLSMTGFDIASGMDGVVQTFRFAEGDHTRDQVFANYVSLGNAVQHDVDGGLTVQGTEYDDVMEAASGGGGLVLHGNGGNDTLQGWVFAEQDQLYGGSGNDTLIGYAGDDLLDGGSGNDMLYGGQTYSFYEADDTYVFGRGYDADTVVDFGGNSKITFEPGIARADVDIRVPWKSDDLVLEIKDTGDTLTVQDWMLGSDRQMPVVLDDVTLTPVDLAASDERGSTGDDTLRGSRDPDRLFGDAGNDTIIAKGGDDTLDGSAGNDVLEGNEGNDTYLFSGTWGSDTIMEDDSTAGNTDTVAFGSGLEAVDIVFEQTVDDLHVSRVAGADTVDIQDWYSGTDFQTEVFRASDGSTLDNTQVDQLIQAMANFVTDKGASSWEDAVTQYRSEAETVVMSHWQASA